MRTLVSLDIETTGLNNEQDAIIEIGLVKFKGDDVIEEWNGLINPRRSIPAKITELTGISDAMVQHEGRDLFDCLREVSRIVGSAPIIGHNISFDLGFLKKQRHFERNASIDTFELASILVPHAGRYSLGSLAKELGISLPATHRALDDARVAHHLYLKVFDRAVQLSRDVLEEITLNAERSGWLLAEFWRDALETQTRGTFSTSIGSALSGALKKTKTGQTALTRQASRRALLDAKPLKPKDDLKPLDVDKVAKTLATDGPFATLFPGYETRPPQMDMLRKVTEAFNKNHHAFIEAGTGTGKSLAYLIPAMMWAIQNGERVVVSTNTINLQEQLADKDVPLVIHVLGDQGRAAVMKGKSRYMCQLRLQDLRKVGPRTLDEVRVLTKILIWLPNTLTGDADELFMPAPGERTAFQHLSAQNPACNMNTCTATDCYFFQARRLAESAHVVIVNHALLLADIAVENRALPEYKRLIIDEAHHLESAATDSLTFQIDREEMGRALGELGRTTTQGSTVRRSQGLLNDIAAQARRSLAVDQSGAMEMLADNSANAVGRAFTNVAAFFDLVLDFFADEVAKQSDYPERVRFTRQVRNRAGWKQLEIGGDNMCKELNTLTKSLDTIFRALNDLPDAIEGFDMLLARLNGSIRFMTEASEQLNKLIVKPNDDSIYWAEIENRRNSTRGPQLSLNAAPLRVGPRMQEQLWKVKDSVIMASATMRTAASDAKSIPTFNYIKDRLSAHEADELAVGSPFDYKSSTLVYLVTDIPEPNQPGYQQALERGLIAFYRGSQGRGLALFTSYQQLRTTSRVMSPELIKDEITVYEQGDGTSRRVMLEQFRAADKAVLMGTRSFWEGVDIQGEKLSALAICKLPFDVPTDPIFAARSETFQNSFNDYSVPESVLKFRQGFGRLIRSRADRGVVAIFDKRLISKGYGSAFLNSLPGPTIQRGTISELGKATEAWLKLV